LLRRKKVDFAGGSVFGVQSIEDCIRGLGVEDGYRDFFRLALLAVLPQFSTAVATGGWLKWIKEPIESGRPVQELFAERVQMMIGDLEFRQTLDERLCCSEIADARALPVADESFDFVITSPPYPNRHDYTRVFGIELMFGFLSWEDLRKVRYQSFHSHPEARPLRPVADVYSSPAEKCPSQSPCGASIR
jgi:hypothetical protein